MLRCPSKMSLSAYSDGELNAQQLQAITEHITQCESCAQEVCSLQALTKKLQDLPLEIYNKRVVLPKYNKNYPLKWKPVLVICVVLIITLSLSYYYEFYGQSYQVGQVADFLVDHAVGERLHVSSYGLFGN